MLIRLNCLSFASGFDGEAMCNNRGGVEYSEAQLSVSTHTDSGMKTSVITKFRSAFVPYRLSEI